MPAEPPLEFMPVIRSNGVNAELNIVIDTSLPVHNAYIERFNRTFREEVLEAYLFTDLEQAQDMANDWIRGYNEQRPHESLGGLPPTLFREKVTAKSSTLQLST
jgi:putative transposase